MIKFESSFLDWMKTIILDKMACSVKWNVFMSNGAGNFPNLSPKSVLLYLHHEGKEKKKSTPDQF